MYRMYLNAQEEQCASDTSTKTNLFHLCTVNYHNLYNHGHLFSLSHTCTYTQIITLPLSTGQNKKLYACMWPAYIYVANGDIYVYIHHICIYMSLGIYV